ncbi:MAG: hypothetical protein Q3998_01185 [Porphyromonas sp.]|nr:hypothetical protein [Porphyromonas sp.]
MIDGEERKPQVEDKYSRVEMFALGEGNSRDRNSPNVLILKEVKGTAGFPILIPPLVHPLVKMRLRIGSILPKEEAITLLDSLLRHTNYSVEEIRIVEELLVRNSCWVKIQGDITEGNTHTSYFEAPLLDSVLVAIRKRIPIYVHKDLLDKFRDKLVFNSDHIVIRLNLEDNKHKPSLIPFGRINQDSTIRRVFNETYPVLGQEISDDQLERLHVLEVFQEKIKSDSPETIALIDLFVQAELRDLQDVLDAMVKEEKYEWASILHDAIKLKSRTDDISS